MELKNMIDDVQRALIGYEELHGARVRLTMVGVGSDGRDMDIKFIVPSAKIPDEPKKGEPDTEEEVAMPASMPEMLREATELLLNQIDMTQEYVARDRPEGKQLADINNSMCGIAHTMEVLSGEYRRWESEMIRRKLETMREAEKHNDEQFRKYAERPCVR